MLKIRLPDDGIICVFRERVPRFDIVTVKIEDYDDFPRKTILELITSMDVRNIAFLSLYIYLSLTYILYFHRLARQG